LTNGIHLLRTLCPDDPPEAAELLDYFDSTYISGRLRQQNPVQNQAVRPVSTSHLQRTWCQSTVMPEPTKCARAGTTSSSTC
jgi:hypothetical protein